MALQLFKIASVEVQTPQASIDFSSIPSGYTDLKIVLSVRSTSTGNGIYLGFNSSTSNFSRRTLQGNGATAASGSGSTNFSGYICSNSDTSNTFANTELYIPNYTSTNAKSISFDSVEENNGTTAYCSLTALLWNPTSNVAITSISLTPDSSNNFAAGTTATLYGVL